jgi:hypothetical protein
MRSSSLRLLFPPGAPAESHQFSQVIAHVLVGLALVQQFYVFLDQAFPASQEEGNLPYLHIFTSQLRASHKGRKVIGDRLGRVT